MYGGLPHDAQPPPHKRNRVSEDYSSGGAGGSGGGRLFDSSGGAGPMMVNQHSPMRKSPTNISPQQQSLPPPAPNPHPPAAAATVPNPLNTIWNEINELSDVDRIKIEQFISGQYGKHRIGMH